MKDEVDDMLPEYDFSGGVRGKYVARYAAGTNVVRIDLDLMDVFPDSESVNAALRAVAPLLRAREGHGGVSLVRDADDDR